MSFSAEYPLKKSVPFLSGKDYISNSRNNYEVFNKTDFVGCCDFEWVVLAESPVSAPGEYQ
jgi:hypothetical protein